MPDFYRFLGEADLHSRAFRRPLSSPLLSSPSQPPHRRRRRGGGGAHAIHFLPPPRARRGAAPGGTRAVTIIPLLFFRDFSTKRRRPRPSISFRVRSFQLLRYLRRHACIARLLPPADRSHDADAVNAFTLIEERRKPGSQLFGKYCQSLLPGSYSYGE